MDDLDTGRGGNTFNEGREVVGARDGQARCHVTVCAHALAHLGLGTRDTLARTEQADVARAHIGDAGKGRLCAARHARNLAGVVHAHLEDENLGVFGRGEHRKRKTKKVIEVAGRRMDAALGRESGTEKVLGRGLAHRARDAHDKPLGMAGAPLGGKLHEEGFAIVVRCAKNGTTALGRCLKKTLGRFCGKDDRTCSGINRGARESVAVNTLAGKGDKHIARAQAT